MVSYQSRFETGTGVKALSSSEKPVKWSSFWNITGGVITCKTCKCEQVETDAALPFEHARGCGHAQYIDHPWGDLRSIGLAHSK